MEVSELNAPLLADGGATASLLVDGESTAPLLVPQLLLPHPRSPYRSPRRPRKTSTHSTGSGRSGVSGQSLMSEECDEEYEALDVKSLYDPLPGRIAAGLLLSYFAMGITYVSLIGFSLGSRQGLVAGLLVLVTVLFANVFSFLLFERLSRASLPNSHLRNLRHSALLNCL